MSTLFGAYFISDEILSGKRINLPLALTPPLQLD